VWKWQWNQRSRQIRIEPAEARQGWLPAGVVAGALLSSEQERVLLEHLPIVRFLARRIHERLPQHVDIEDLVSAGWWG